MTVAPPLAVSRETQARLDRFAALLRRWNPVINLVAASTLADLDTRHLADSAQLPPLAPEARTWVDLGSGGGLPGLVVAILAAGTGHPRVTLIESDGRKATFLRTVARELALDVAILDQRAEAAAPQDADVVSARALAPLPALLPLVARHLAPGGVALLPKGRDWAAEVDAAGAGGWLFDLDAVPSVTDGAARVLRLAGLRRA